MGKNSLINSPVNSSSLSFLLKLLPFFGILWSTSGKTFNIFSYCLSQIFTRVVIIGVKINKQQQQQKWLWNWLRHIPLKYSNYFLRPKSMWKMRNLAFLQTNSIVIIHGYYHQINIRGGSLIGFRKWIHVNSLTTFVLCVFVLVLVACWILLQKFKSEKYNSENVYFFRLLIPLKSY